MCVGGVWTVERRWRAVVESVHSVIGVCGGNEVVARVRPSFMAVSSAARMVVWGWSFQFVVM